MRGRHSEKSRARVFGTPFDVADGSRQRPFRKQVLARAPRASELFYYSPSQIVETIAPTKAVLGLTGTAFVGAIVSTYGRSARQRAAAFGRVSGNAFCGAPLCPARCLSKGALSKMPYPNYLLSGKAFRKPRYTWISRPSVAWFAKCFTSPRRLQVSTIWEGINRRAKRGRSYYVTAPL
jgi:hypothetical protein